MGLLAEPQQASRLFDFNKARVNLIIWIWLNMQPRRLQRWSQSALSAWLRFILRPKIKPNFQAPDTTRAFMPPT